MTITANTKSARNYVRNVLATSDVRVTGSWTDDNSMPGHRNVTFRVQYDKQSDMNDAFKHISLGLAFEGIRVKYRPIKHSDFDGAGAAYLRLNRVRFEG